MSYGDTDHSATYWGMCEIGSRVELWAGIVKLYSSYAAQGFHSILFSFFMMENWHCQKNCRDNMYSISSRNIGLELLCHRVLVQHKIIQRTILFFMGEIDTVRKIVEICIQFHVGYLILQYHFNMFGFCW